MAAKDNTDRKAEDQSEETTLDMSQTAVKKMIGEARERGYITYDQLNKVLPPDQVSSEQIEDVMSMLSEMGINIIEAEDAEEEERGATDLVAATSNKEVALSSGDSEKLDRTDDPVRMYLRELGSVELLSREGEIAIAKRIEAGRENMIGGLCESPLTMRTLVEWRDEIVAENMLLRDVIDLESTYGKPEGPSANNDNSDEDGEDGAAKPANGEAAKPASTARRLDEARSLVEAARGLAKMGMIV